MRNFVAITVAAPVVIGSKGLWLKFIVKECKMVFFPLDSVVFVFNLFSSFRSFVSCIFFGRPLILWNSQLFVTNVPTKVGYTSVSISIPHTLCLLVFLWYQIRREYIYFDWTMWVVSIRSFDISQLLCAIWPLCKGGFRCYHIHCAPWTTVALYRIFMAF